MQKGEFVRVNYVGRLESGEVFDLTDEATAKKEHIHSDRAHYGPIPIIVGVGFVIPGLDKEIMKMEVGDKRTVAIEPKDGFGERNAELVRTVPEKAFREQKVEPKQGMIVDFGGMKGRIQSVSGGRVMVDFNNPLAGKKLNYDLEIVAKIDDPLAQVRGVFEFFGAHNADVRIDGGNAIVNIALPQGMKQRLSGLILANVKGLEKITFQEVYSKKDTHPHDHAEHEHAHMHE